jgi:hypothetical protein
LKIKRLKTTKKSNGQNRNNTNYKSIKVEGPEDFKEDVHQNKKHLAARIVSWIETQIKFTKMKNNKITASIAIDEQKKIMGGVEIVPKPRPKTIIDQILESMKPTPTIPIMSTIQIF